MVICNNRRRNQVDKGEINLESNCREGKGIMTDRYPEMNETIGYIHHHLDEPLSLSELARYAAYSPYHFTRIFKEKMGSLLSIIFQHYVFKRQRICC